MEFGLCFGAIWVVLGAVGGAEGAGGITNVTWLRCCLGSVCRTAVRGGAVGGAGDGRGACFSLHSLSYWFFYL